MITDRPVFRQLALLNFLERSKSAVTLKDISTHLESTLDIDSKKYAERTFQRDKEAIYRDFGIVIKFDSKLKGYSVSGSIEALGLETINAFKLTNALLLKQELLSFISLGTQSLKGLNHLGKLIKAILDDRVVELVYKPHYYNEPTTQQVEPYGLKEFKGLWYLLAIDKSNAIFKTYGLDRIVKIDTLKTRFKLDESLNPFDSFHDVYGVIRLDEEQIIEDVILQFTPLQFKYILNNPLHSSQQDLSNETGLCQVSLRLYVTFDFEMELLSMGETVKVIQPTSLVERLKERLKSALSQYDV